MTNDLIIMQMYSEEDTFNVEAQDTFCFSWDVRACVFVCLNDSCVSVCQTVCHGTVRESICTDGHIITGLWFESA